MIKGKADTLATSKWAKDYKEIAFTPLGTDGPLVSKVGFGCYRVTHRIGDHATALLKAIEKGVNLIDTSTNYTDGESETLVGQVLQELVEQNGLNRSSFVIVSKIGYLQGNNLKHVHQAGKVKDLVPYAKDLEHCIHPEFLSQQLTLSLTRLGISCLDVLLLHNPEYYLAWAVKKKGMPLPEARTEYHRRLKLAFSHLENERKQGRIGCFGVSSNSFVTNDTDPEFTSLDMVCQAAAEADVKGFKVIQMPLNLLEPGAVLIRNQPGDISVLDYARLKGLAVLVNRPFNAMSAGRLVRLAQKGMPMPGPSRLEVVDGLMGLMDSEDQLKSSLIPNMELNSDLRNQVMENISLGKTLVSSWEGLSGQEHWKGLEAYFLVPRVNSAVQVLAKKLESSTEGLSVLDKHLKVVSHVFSLLSAWHSARDQELSAKVWEKIKNKVPEWGKAGSLSHMALRALLATKGITSTLVGMRKPVYVEDVFEEFSKKPPVLRGVETWLALKDCTKDIF